MLISFAYYLAGFFLGFVSGVASIFTSLTPVWVITGIGDAMKGANFLNGFLPMYPDHALSGIASQTGIMPIIGWLIVVLTGVVSVRFGWMIVKFILRILPWNTTGNDLDQSN